MGLAFPGKGPDAGGERGQVMEAHDALVRGGGRRCVGSTKPTSSSVRISNEAREVPNPCQAQIQESLRASPAWSRPRKSDACDRGLTDIV